MRLSCSYCSKSIHFWLCFVVVVLFFMIIEAPEQKIVNSPRSKNCVQRSINVNSVKAE